MTRYIAASSLLLSLCMWRTASSFVSRKLIVNQRAFTAASSWHGLGAFHLDEGEADVMEQLVGGERYSMVPLPDSMMDTTLFVGNLCEFVHDGDLSLLFECVCSDVHKPPPPACVSRKPNRDSLQYGFVTFATRKEKEAAIIRFDGYEWRGRSIKVQPIVDHPINGRVRVPEKLVAFCCGPVKSSTRQPHNTKDTSLRRISRDDVERLSRGQPSKRKGYGSRNVPHRLNDEERSEFDRAARKGFLTVNGPTGIRRTRKGSPLVNIHRQWCDARAKPQIVLYKASNGQTLDILEVDFSPLRLHALTTNAAGEFMVQWKADMFTAATMTGMDVTLDEEVFIDAPIECSEEEADDECSAGYMVVVDQDNPVAWATRPIWKLPVVSLGTFEGPRSSAKQMAKELGKLWEIPEVDAVTGEGPKSRRAAGATKGGKTKVKGISERRRQRGGGHRQAW
ncbi:hypothetical protein MPSEU_000335500 [Mayamaea pseudoterrestris]|nr:hypothetical protein MPSEU_000335500 [Mayamaea pseudoterrestris]